MRENKSTAVKKTSPLREGFLIVFTAIVVVALFFSYEIAKGLKLYERVVNDASFYPILYPLHLQFRRTLSEGFFPLWWANLGLGMPILGMWWTSALYPLSLIFLPLDFWKVSNIFFLFRIWLMVIGAYYLARKSFLLSPNASCLSAFTFAFSGYTIERLQMWEAGVFWLIPLFAYCLSFYSEKPSWKRIIAGGLVGAMAIYSGHPPQAFYVFFFGISLGFFRLLIAVHEENLSFRSLNPYSTKSFLKKVGESKILPSVFGISAIFALSILLSSAQLLPALEILNTYWHHHPVSDVTFGYPARGFFSMILPWLAGSQRNNPLTALLMRHMGLVPVTLALFGVIKIKKLSKNAGFAAVMIFIMLGVCYNLPIFRAWGHLPGFNRLANFVNMLPTLALCVGLLAGEVLDYLMKDKEKKQDFLNFLSWWFGFLILGFVYGFWLVKFLTGTEKISGLVASYEILKRDWLIQVSFSSLLILLLVIISIFWQKNERSVWAGRFVLLLAFVGLFWDRSGFNYQSYGLFDKIKQSEAMKKFERLIKNESYPVRATSDFIPLYGTWLAGASEVRVISTALPFRYIYFMGKVNDLDWETNPAHQQKFKEHLKLLTFPFPLEKLKTPLANLLGVKYAIVKPVENMEGMDVLYSSSEGMIIRSEEVFPRCFLARGIKVFKSANDVLDFMTKSSETLDEALFAESDYPQTARWDDKKNYSSSETSSCKILSYTDQKVLFETDTNNETFAIITDLYQPGWKATVNRKEKKLFIADYLLKAVKIPPGKSKVTIWYEPASFKVGLWLTVVSFSFSLVVGGLAFHDRCRRK